MNVRNKKKQKSTTDRDSDADGQEVRSLGSTTAKEEQEIVDIDHSGLDVPNPIIQKSYQVLGKERNRLVYFSTCHFKDLCGMYEEDEGHSLVDSVDLVLTDPPYNTRSDLNCANSEDDVFTNTDIANFVGVTDVTLRTGGHAIIFWSFRQFGNWYDEFFDVCYDVEDDDDDSDDKERTEEDDSDKQKKRSEDVFMVEKIPLCFVPSRGNYNCNVRNKRLHHLSMQEIAIHAWKKGLSLENNLARVYYTILPSSDCFVIALLPLAPPLQPLIFRLPLPLRRPPQ